MTLRAPVKATTASGVCAPQLRHSLTERWISALCHFVVLKLFLGETQLLSAVVLQESDPSWNGRADHIMPLSFRVIDCLILLENNWNLALLSRGGDSLRDSSTLKHWQGWPLFLGSWSLLCALSFWPNTVPPKPNTLELSPHLHKFWEKKNKGFYFIFFCGIGGFRTAFCLYL